MFSNFRNFMGMPVTVTENFPHLVSLQITLSSTVCWTLFPFKATKNLQTSSNSQSLNGLEKSGLQLPPPSLHLHTSLTQASLKTARANKEGKETQRGSSPHQISFQNFTLCPFPTTKNSLLLTTSHSFLRVFHNPTP